MGDLLRFLATSAAKASVSESALHQFPYCQEQLSAKQRTFGDTTTTGYIPSNIPCEGAADAAIPRMSGHEGGVLHAVWPILQTAKYIVAPESKKHSRSRGIALESDQPSRDFYKSMSTFAFRTFTTGLCCKKIAQLFGKELLF